MLRPARHETIRVRGLDIHLRRWGPAPAAGEAPVILLHGFQDTGDTFQFLVDAFERDWPLAALDWRGFGRSGWAQDGYWFPDYLADLDRLLDLLSPGGPARLVGHSMGGNVASLYAGSSRACALRRQSRGFRSAAHFARGCAGTATQVARASQDVPPLKAYDSFEQLASIIEFRYPRFSEGVRIRRGGLG